MTVPHVGFVLEQTLGHITHADNLRRLVPQHGAIDATFSRWASFKKSWPPRSPVVLLKSREPIALHWPVIELAPVPGRPILPVIKARLMIACAVRTA